MAENQPSRSDGPHVTEQVDELLYNHVSFDQAVVVLMQLFGADADAAADMLGAKADQNNVPPSELAERILAYPSRATELWR